MQRRNRIGDIRTVNALFTSSEHIALEAGEPMPGPEHLVMAALDLPDRSARRVFETLGVDPDTFRDAVEAQHTAALEAAGIGGSADLAGHLPPPPSKPRGLFRTTGAAETVFKRVVKLVRKEKSQLYGAYVLLVASQAEHGTVPRALREMGLEPAAVATAARSELDGLNR